MLYVEDKMEDLCVAHNHIVDSFYEHSEEINWLKNKIANLEDRCQPNNIKFRGIPESVFPSGSYCLPTPNSENFGAIFI